MLAEIYLKKMCSAECQTLMKLGFLSSLNVCFSWVYAHLNWLCWKFCKEYVNCLHYTCMLLTQFLSYMFKWTNIMFLSFCVLSFGNKKKIFSVIVSYLLCCLHVQHIILSRVPSWSTKTGPFLKWQQGLDQCQYNSKRPFPPYTTYEMEKCPSTGCVQWIYNDCLR